MTTATPARPQRQPARPASPPPVWERHKLFQEPAYLMELPPLEDEDGDGDRGW
ncbi:hypothetical protein [Streptomyces bluensis]|uniref:Uncharacterized protein n=1 Tax=Streptomyces bluensis TaxID=33897 RepID=A0ABW6UUB3_9ACTN